MLSLVTILVISGMIVVGIRAKVKNWSYKKTMTLMVLGIYLIIFLMASLYGMFKVIQQNDTGYLQNQVDTLTQANEKLEGWKKEVNEDLNDNPELLNYINNYIENEIEENNKEIIRCSGLQEDRVPLYRWLLYFG